MKKLIYGTLFLATVGISIVGCKKEKIENSLKTNENDFFTDGKMLIFKSPESYTKIVENQSLIEREAFYKEISTFKFSKFNSNKHSTIKTENNISTEIDDFLGQILNENGIVQIGNYIYKVNLDLEIVFVLPASNESEYNDLVNENISNKNIRRYSTSDEVITLVESGDTGMKGLFCDESGAQIRNENDGRTITIFNGDGHYIYTEVKYLKAGIYFRLNNIITAYTLYTDLENTQTKEVFDRRLKIDIRRKYKKKCSDEHDWHSWSSEGYAADDLSNYKFKSDSYEGSKPLSKYWMQTSFWYKHNGNWEKIGNKPNIYGTYHTGIKYGY